MGGPPQIHGRRFEGEGAGGGGQAGISQLQEEVVNQKC